MLSGFRKPRQVAVFISGGGSTLQALLEVQHDVNIVLIITNKKNALGNLKAKRFGKKIIFLDKQITYASLHEILLSHRIDSIILAGFMKLLPAEFVEKWQSRIINIHPSLLPLYPGLDSAEKSWSDNSDMGVTLHKVIAEMDAGEILLQLKSLVLPRQLSLDEANLFLRRTEQFLLRKMTARYCP